MRRALLIVLALLIVVALAGTGGGYLWLRNAYHAPLASASDSVVNVERGQSVNAIARKLQSAGVISSSSVFRFGLRLFGAKKPLRAGEFLIPANASPADVARVLQEGEPIVYKATVAEGLTSAEIVAIVEAEPKLSGKIASVPPEGALLPETYHFHRGDSRVGLLDRMETAMETALEGLWDKRLPGLPLASASEALILASIVEKETAVADERPRVAAVFINRLRRGMRLQSDPTVVYGITGGTGPLERSLTRRDLDTPTPYNTYQIDGLPPTPIANPGLASIAAVLNPMETDELYFVADGSGGHAFAKTLNEHNRNVRAWRKLQKQN